MLKIAELLGRAGKELVEYGEGFVNFITKDIPDELSYLVKGPDTSIKLHDTPLIYEEVETSTGEIIKIQPKETIEQQIERSQPRAIREARQERLNDAIFKYLIPSFAVGTAGVALTSAILLSLTAKENIPH